MKKRTLLLIIIFIIIIFIIASLPNEKGYLKRDIKALKNSVERENRQEILSYIAENYTDKSGIKYDDLPDLIQQFFKDFDSIKILMSGLKLKIDSTNKEREIFASCSLGLKVIASHEDEKVILFGSIIKPASVKGYFKKSAQNYKIYSAEY